MKTILVILMLTGSAQAQNFTIYQQGRPPIQALQTPNGNYNVYQQGQPPAMIIQNPQLIPIQPMQPMRPLGFPSLNLD